MKNTKSSVETFVAANILLARNVCICVKVFLGCIIMHWTWKYYYQCVIWRTYTCNFRNVSYKRAFLGEDSNMPLAQISFTPFLKHARYEFGRNSRGLHRNVDSMKSQPRSRTRFCKCNYAILRDGCRIKAHALSSHFSSCESYLVAAFSILDRFIVSRARF